jgi:hypothetical protein
VKVTRPKANPEREVKKAMAVAPEQNLRVQVSGWSYSRHVILRNGSVEMEIARTHCSHCPTCRGRISRCESALAGREFGRRSAGGGEYFVLPYPAEAGRDPQSVAAFLSGALQLAVAPA